MQYCSIITAWYKELKVKEFCAFDYIELQSFDDLFQNSYFKKHFAENKVKVHMFNPLQPGVAFLLPPENIRKLKGFLKFSGVIENQYRAVMD